MVDSETLMSWIEKNGGVYTAKTVEGGELKFSMKGNNIMITDEMGDMATVTIKDLYQKNGVIHVIDTVLLPE